MIGFLIKIAIVAVIGILGYNYFFGTSEEKAQSSKVFGQMKDVAVSVGELTQSETKKFEAGKYDDALDKLADAYKIAREGAHEVDASLLKRIGELEKRRAGLEKEVASLDQASAQNPTTNAEEAARRKDAIQAKLEQLIADSDAVLKQASKK
jgi:hypothetical protein